MEASRDELHRSPPFLMFNVGLNSKCLFGDVFGLSQVTCFLLGQKNLVPIAVIQMSLILNTCEHHCGHLVKGQYYQIETSVAR